MNAGPSGFQTAPITEGVVVVCGLATLVVGTTRKSIIKACGLSYQAVVQKLQLWRLGTSNCVFSSTPELVFGLYLIYFFRVFERQIGSNKYAVWVVQSEVNSRAMLEVCVLTFFRDPTSSGLTLAPGPYGLIFASFVPFFFDIPISTWFRVFGIQFSDKSFIYLAGLQSLVFMEAISYTRFMWRSCWFYIQSNIFGIRRFKGPFVPNQPPSRGGGVAAVAAGVPPPEESIATLVSMGFDRGLAVPKLGMTSLLLLTFFWSNHVEGAFLAPGRVYIC